MQTSFFSQALPATQLIALAARLDPTAQIFCTDDQARVDCFAHFRDGSPGSLSYFDDAKYDGPLGAGCFIAQPNLADQITGNICILTDDPRRMFIEMALYILATIGLDYDRFTTPPCVAPGIGDSDIHPSATIMDGCRIGNGCHIGPAVVIFPGTVIEDNVTIKSGAMVGESGAAIHILPDRTLSQPHVGRVWVQAGTEIGSQANIVRGIFGTTRIGPRCVIGNQVNVGHNVTIDEGTWLGVGSVIGGFTQIGAFANIGMGTVCRNGLTLGTGCNVAMGSVLSKSLPNDASCFGNPAKPTGVRLSAGPAKDYRNAP